MILLDSAPKHNFEAKTRRVGHSMTARDRRLAFAIAISTAIVLSIAAGAILLRHRPSVEIRVTDVGMISDAPQNGMTEIRLQLILQNVGSSQAHFTLLTLFAYDPAKGTLFGTFAHSEVRLEPGGTRTFSETTFVTGHWSEVAFTVKVFPNGAPSWARSLDPNETLTWTA